MMNGSVWAHATIIFLTGILVGLNGYSALTQYSKDKDRQRFLCSVATLLLLGVLILFVANGVLSRVIEAQMMLSAHPLTS